MARVHLLTVGEGDCTIIRSNKGRITVIDICGGNREMSKQQRAYVEASEKPRGNFAMCKQPTNPIDYLHSLGVTQIWRFVLTHPDMDHLDGFDALASEFKIVNFWDSGARKDKPDFSQAGAAKYREQDWDRYVKFRDSKEEGVTTVTPTAGSKFQYANEPEDDNDYLFISSPSKTMIEEANAEQEFNDASYIITYRSSGGMIVIPGDAHDKSFEYAINNHADSVKNATFFLAAHHGRKSNRKRDYLKTLNPSLTLLGCAPSEHLDYAAWRNRNLEYFTQNQAGNVVLEPHAGYIDVFVENEKFAEQAGGDTSITNDQGYCYYRRIEPPSPA